MKIEQLREQTNEELIRRTNELKHDMLNMRIQQASGQLENPSRIKLLRREVARVETILSERRLNLTVGKKASADAAPASAEPAASKKAAKKAPAKKAAKKASSAAAAE